MDKEKDIVTEEFNENIMTTEEIILTEEEKRLGYLRMVKAAKEQFGIDLNIPEEYANPDNPFEPTEPETIPPNEYTAEFKKQLDEFAKLHPEVLNFNGAVVTMGGKDFKSSNFYTLILFEADETTEIKINGSPSPANKRAEQVTLNNELKIRNMKSDKYAVITMNAIFNDRKPAVYSTAKVFSYENKPGNDQDIIKTINPTLLSKNLAYSNVKIIAYGNNEIAPYYLTCLDRGYGYTGRVIYEELFPFFPKLKRAQNAATVRFNRGLRFFFKATKNDGTEEAYIFDKISKSGDTFKISGYGEDRNGNVYYYKDKQDGFWYQGITKPTSQTFDKGNYKDILTNHKDLQAFLLEKGYTGTKPWYDGFPANWKNNLVYKDKQYWMLRYNQSGNDRSVMLYFFDAIDPSDIQSSSSAYMRGISFGYDFSISKFYFRYPNSGASFNIKESAIKNLITNHKDFYNYIRQQGQNNSQYIPTKNTGKGEKLDIVHGLITDDTGKQEPEKPEVPSGPVGLPTGHKYFLKATEGSIQVCYTFDGFQHRDGNWNINAANGRILKYIYDGGCWHFFSSFGASRQIKTILKDVTTNNKDLHDFLMKNKGKHTGKLIHYSKDIDISKYFWQKSRNLYFASWTSEEKTEKPQDQTFYLALFDFADGNTIRNPDGSSSTPIVAHFENGKIVKLEKGWTDYKTQWKPEGEYKEYRFDKLPKYNNFKTNHRVLWGWLEKHGRIAGSQSKFISPCTEMKPDGTLPDGVIGPPLPPTVKPPGGNNDGYDPSKPGQSGNGLGDNGPINYGDIEQCYSGMDSLTMLTNGKLNGLYYYYLEGSLYQAGGSDNTTILGTTGAICNIAYAPFLNLNASNLCKSNFDTKRYGKIEGIESDDLQPKVFRIKPEFSPKPMKVAQWPIYPKVNRATAPGTPWKYYHESRILDYPYRSVAFISNIFDVYDIIPHLHYQSTGKTNAELNICCPITPGGNFYAWVDDYKGDDTGFIERQYSTTSMDIPNTSSAYSNYMSTQKAQANASVFGGVASGLSAGASSAGAGYLASQRATGFNLDYTTQTTQPSLTAGGGRALKDKVIPGTVNAALTFGSIAGGPAAAMGVAAFSAGMSIANSIAGNLALKKDLKTTPKSLVSMGGDIAARLGCDGNATIVACDMEITEQYKELIARFFHMYGTTQNRILDINSTINSRYYFNYIKTIGCNVISNGVPKKHVAMIKSIFDKGTTLWHVDNAGVNVGEYCVYDNVEV